MWCGTALNKGLEKRLTRHVPQHKIAQIHGLRGARRRLYGRILLPVIVRRMLPATRRWWAIVQTGLGNLRGFDSLRSVAAAVVVWRVRVEHGSQVKRWISVSAIEGSSAWATWVSSRFGGRFARGGERWSLCSWYL